MKEVKREIDHNYINVFFSEKTLHPKSGYALGIFFGLGQMDHFGPKVTCRRNCRCLLKF